MHQLTGPSSLIAANRCRGLAVEVGEPVPVVATQHPVDGGGGHVEVDGLAIGAELLHPAPAADLASSWGVVRMGERRGQPHAWEDDEA